MPIAITSTQQSCLLCFRGTKTFVVEVGETSEGPWTKIAEGQLSEPAPMPVPMKKISVENPQAGRYVQYRCITGYSGICGLQYIGVFQSTTITTTTTAATASTTTATTATSTLTVTTKETPSGLFYDAFVTLFSYLGYE